MTPDFFIRLTLAVYKVADILPRQYPLKAQIKDSANKLLASLVLLTEENPITKEQKRSVTPRAIKELGLLIAYLNYAKRTSELNPGNFLVLEREYNRVGEFLRKIHEDMATGDSGVRPAPQRPTHGQPDAALERTPSSIPPKSDLSTRQTRILEIIRHKQKTQVWELQKVLPEVTKRTLRRDIDDLLSRKFIIRQGEWNEVFYQIR